MTRRGHNDGGIDQRGKDRWRLRWRVGERRYSKTVEGTKRDAQAELRRILKAVDDGTHVAPDRTTVAEYLRSWLTSDADLSPKTLERYRQLLEGQIVPHLGSTVVQNLRPAQINDWHALLLKEGGAGGRPLSARTVGHAHRVLHRGFERALRLEVVTRNVAHAVPPPKVQATEVSILTADQIASVLARLEGHPLHPVVAMALGTGMRRGEICALAWGAVDVDAASVRVERSLEETKEGLRFKPPKTKHGRRTVSLPANVVEVLRTHHRKQAEQRLLLGLGRPGDSDLVFARPDGSPYPPDTLSRDWWRLVNALDLPRIMFHALRHSHASALIAAGLDVVAISRRLGHGSPAITLGVYAHQFNQTDAGAAAAIDRAMRGGLAPL